MFSGSMEKDQCTKWVKWLTIEALEKKCEICSKFTPFSSAVIVEFEQVHFSWEALFALIPEQIHVSHFGKFKIQVHEHGFY